MICHVQVLGKVPKELLREYPTQKIQAQQTPQLRAENLHELEQRYAQQTKCRLNYWLDFNQRS